MQDGRNNNPFRCDVQNTLGDIERIEELFLLMSEEDSSMLVLSSMLDDAALMSGEACVVTAP